MSAAAVSSPAAAKRQSVVAPALPVPAFEQNKPPGYDELKLRLIAIGDALDWLTFQVDDGALTPGDCWAAVVCFLRQTLLFGKPADQITSAQQTGGVWNLNAGTGTCDRTAKRSRKKLKTVGFFTRVPVAGSSRGDSFSPDFERFAVDVRRRRADHEWSKQRKVVARTPVKNVPPPGRTKGAPQQNPSGKEQNPSGTGGVGFSDLSSELVISQTREREHAPTDLALSEKALQKKPPTTATGFQGNSQTPPSPKRTAGDRNPQWEPDPLEADAVRTHLEKSDFGVFLTIPGGITDEVVRQCIKAGRKHGANGFQVAALLDRIDKRYAKSDRAATVEPIGKWAYVYQSIAHEFMAARGIDPYAKKVEPQPQAPPPPPPPPLTPEEKQANRELRQIIASVAAGKVMDPRQAPRKPPVLDAGAQGGATATQIVERTEPTPPAAQVAGSQSEPRKTELQTASRPNEPELRRRLETAQQRVRRALREHWGMLAERKMVDQLRAEAEAHGLDWLHAGVAETERLMATARGHGIACFKSD